MVFLTKTDKFFRKKYIKFTLFKCACGNEKYINEQNVLRGKQKSCGCLKIKQAKKMGLNNKKHGKRFTEEYSVWDKIKTRCNNKRSLSYKQYGGRGIKVCDRWLNSFENFLEDMGERPTNKHSIDRIDNNGDYTPENCRWANKAEQANNRNNNLIINYKSEEKTLAEWCFILKLNYETIRHRINYLKWNIEDAFEKPIKQKIKGMIH